MPLRLPDLLSARDASRVATLQWIARGAVEGLSAGRHRSPHKGSSVEFKEHRPYVPGDELRDIDWKAYGKSNRLYIREFEEETNLRCTLVVDQSGSMAYGGKRAVSLLAAAEAASQAKATPTEKQDHWFAGTKQEYAVGVAAALAYLMLSSQDSVGLVTFDSRVRDFLPPRTVPSHLNSLLSMLAKERRGGETDLGLVLKQVAAKLTGRGLVVLISDGLGDVESFGRSLALLKARRHDVVFLQVHDPDELDFPFNERIEFRDLEASDHREVIDARSIRMHYLDALKRHRTLLAAACRRNRVDHVLLTTDASLTDQLARFVALRQAGPVSAEVKP